ncbi:hypothetical protein SATMO3_60340 [Sporomusa aerivorans]
MQIILYKDSVTFDVIESFVMEGRIYTTKRHLPKILERYPDAKIKEISN